ncbi:type II toxin-antitoxin system HicB family antitoxin [Methylobacterium sp. J-059]|uniref:type II toxin-antitoxin system HicB family antitoxin n=1 Tax=Methylobacterium sp. J-059 TaxID=2836643 RepID=UPI001FB97879|nr:type II toxin-antitoxin system HicB family antitoxin [Methylobacterium sp. J-059]MCJ2039060.1 type II toxin-antitoxin system HicB family antitoxin [Methylobacterium sp. J-059]
MPQHYPTEVFWSDEDEGFIAIARDLPGCSAFGETQLEALDELEHAIAAWISATQTAGNSVPAPSRRQTDPTHSGKLLLRLPRTLHSKLAEEAEREAVSLNQYVVCLLAENNAAHVVSKAIANVASQIVLLGMPGRQPAFQTFPTGFDLRQIDLSGSRISKHYVTGTPSSLSHFLPIAGE